jgi:hypothetical protein
MPCFQKGSNTIFVSESATPTQKRKYGRRTEMTRAKRQEVPTWIRQANRDEVAARMRSELARQGRRPAWLYQKLNGRDPKTGAIRYPIGSRATVYKVLRRGTQNFEMLAEIGTVLRVNLPWLLTGEGKRELVGVRNARPSEITRHNVKLEKQEERSVRARLGGEVAEAVLAELRWPAPMREEGLYTWRNERWKALERLIAFLQEHLVTDMARQVRAATTACALLVEGERRLGLNSVRARKTRGRGGSLMYGQFAEHLIQGVIRALVP